MSSEVNSGPSAATTASGSVPAASASVDSGLFKLRVMTFNIWAVPFVGVATDFRIEEILNYLRRIKGQLDVIGFQEVFSLQALKRFHEELPACGFPYLIHFNSGSDMPSRAEGSGLMIASAYPILDTAYHAFTAGGRPYAFHQFDWHSSKGIGLARVLLPGEFGAVDVYVSHLQAQYHDERADDYHDQRVLQAFESAAFIRSTRRSDLTLFLVDANSGPDSQVYKTITTLAGFRDCYSTTHTSETDLVHAATTGSSGNSSSSSSSSTVTKKQYTGGGTLTATRTRGGREAAAHPNPTLEASRMVRSIYDSTFGGANNTFSYLFKKRNKQQQQQQQQQQGKQQGHAGTPPSSRASSTGSTESNSNSSDSLPPLKSQHKHAGRERAGSLLGRQRLFSDVDAAEAAAVAQEEQARQSWFCCPKVFDKVEQWVEGASAPPACDLDVRLDYVFMGTGSPSWPFVVAPFSVNLLHRTWHCLYSDIRCSQLVTTDDGRQINLSDHSAVYAELGCVILAPTLVSTTTTATTAPTMRHQNSAPAALAEAAAAAVAAEVPTKQQSQSSSSSSSSSTAEEAIPLPRSTSSSFSEGLSSGNGNGSGGSHPQLLVTGFQQLSSPHPSAQAHTQQQQRLSMNSNATGFGGPSSRRFSADEEGPSASTSPLLLPLGTNSTNINASTTSSSLITSEAMLKQALLAAGVPLDRCAAYLPGEVSSGSGSSSALLPPPSSTSSSSSSSALSSLPRAEAEEAATATSASASTVRQRKGVSSSSSTSGGDPAGAAEAKSSGSSSAVAVDLPRRGSFNNRAERLYNTLVTSLANSQGPLARVVTRPLLALRHWDKLSFQALKPLMEISAKQILGAASAFEGESASASLALLSPLPPSKLGSGEDPAAADPATRQWHAVLDSTLACIERGRQDQELLRLKQLRGGHFATLVGLLCCLAVWLFSSPHTSSLALAGAVNACLIAVGFIWAYATIMRTATLPVAVGRLVALVLTGIVMHVLLYRHAGLAGLLVSFGVGCSVLGVLCYFNGTFLSAREIRDYNRAIAQIKVLKTRPPGVVA